MSTSLKIILFLLLPVLSAAQQYRTDSLKEIFRHSTDDSVLYKAANHLYDYYEEVSRDSAFFYAGQCVLLSRKNNKKLNEAYSLSRKAYQELNLGRFAEAFNSLLDGFLISENTANENLYWQIDPLRMEQYKRLYALSCTHHIYALLMWHTQNIEQETIHFKEAKKIAVEINSPGRSLLGSLNLGRIYLETNRPDSAMLYENEAEEIAKYSGRIKYLTSILHFKGLISMRNGDTAAAIQYFYTCIQSGVEQNNLDGLVRGYHELANYYIGKKNRDSSLYYAIKEMETFKKLGSVSVIDYHIGIAYQDLNKIYQMRNQFDSAYKYLALTQTTNDSINEHKIISLAKFQQLSLGEQQRLQNIEKERVIYQNKVRTYFLLTGIGVLLLLAIIFYRNNRQKQKANIKIEQAYNNLKATQQQLIQSEKMASLGELTAGIAHEIQNPLNFVNNFSEVNTELIEELKGERQKAEGERNKQLEDELLNDLSNNLEKINHHGKRADAIVKGMLQHSQSSNGVKEPTDINALADEYLRLSYHGFWAKDKSFNAILKTDFDETIGNINIIPQDIGKVILNLINNAFYVVNERQKNPHPLKGGEVYEPVVTVTTRRLGSPLVDGGKVEIKVIDNGNGIPQKILDKIFQPFFTTKPTGQGTGLGLSLSYDIAKAHGGEIKVVTKEGEGSTFIIQLPII